jgi:hypothetical protein
LLSKCEALSSVYSTAGGRREGEKEGGKRKGSDISFLML